MPNNIKLRHLIPALIALVTVTYGLFISAVNTRNNLQDSRKVSHSRQVIIALQDTLRFMLELEIRQRDFILSGAPDHLAAYETAVDDAHFSLQQLAGLTRENPAQQARVRAISEVSEQRMTAIKRSVDLALESPQAALSEFTGGVSGNTNDPLRSLIEPMRKDEVMQLERSQKKLEGSLRQTNLTLFIADGVAIGAGVLCALSVLLFLSARDREEFLRLQKEKAEDADRAKSEFLAMISHEIRTPMNAILGFGELLSESVKTPREKHFATAILSSGNALLSLINDILDLSKVEAGKLQIQAEPVGIAKFAEGLETLFYPRAQEKNLTLSVIVEPDTPPVLMFDSLRLRQVIINLAGNAIKFTHQGSVSISIATLRDASGTIEKLRVRVSDTGIGISEAHISQIFRPFYQIDSLQSRQFQGTGLGLSISMKLTEAMGGEITAGSRIHEGSEFIVTIPTRVGQCEIPAPDPAAIAAEALKHQTANANRLPTPADVTPPADFRQLCISLDELRHTIWPDLVKLIPAQGTINFSNQLMELAGKHDCPVLANHASELLESALIMDFAESERLLKDFPQLINTLRSQHG